MSRKNHDSVFVIVNCVGFILPLIPILLTVLFYFLPRNFEPYFVDLSGRWHVDEPRNNKTVVFPGSLFNYDMHIFDAKVHRQVVIKETMTNEDLSLIIFGSMWQSGKVYFNDIQIGEIGDYEKYKKPGSGQGMDRFYVIKSIVKLTNVIALRLHSEDYAFIGIADHRFYLGVSRYMDGYYENNAAVNYFFQYGVIFFSVLMLLIMLILVITEWNSPDRYKYIAASMYLIVSLIYNWLFSLALLGRTVSPYFVDIGLSCCVMLFQIVNLEFVQFYFMGKINLLGKINRVIAALTVLIYVVFYRNIDFLNAIYPFVGGYTLAVYLYTMILIIFLTLRGRGKKYGFIILYSIFIIYLAGINDILITNGVWNFPMVFTTAASCVSIIVTIVVIAEFVNISVINKQLAITLSQANKELKEIDRLKNQFLANTSHELRTPLNGIFGLVEAIIDGADGVINDKTKNHLSMVMRSATNLKNLVNDILDFSKVQAGENRLNIEEMDIKTVLEEEVKPAVAGLVANKPVELVFGVEDDLPLAYADKDKVRQIMINLIGNAVKFTQQGSVKILVTRSEKEGYLLVQVKDTGIGMKQGDLKVIFEAFRQVDGSATRKYEGTGLGLSISKQLIEAHGGNIWVESQPGAGSVFFFTLCTRADLIGKRTGSATLVSGKNNAASLQDYWIENHQMNPDMQKTEFESGYAGLEMVPRGNEEKLLLVDDLEINLEVLAMNLESKGYRISKALSAQEALALLRKEDFYLVISDVMMPEMDGYQLTKTIREEFRNRKIPVILLTAKTRLEDKRMGFQSGADDYMVKPFQMGELLLRVRRLIEKRDERGDVAMRVAEKEYETEKDNRYVGLTQGCGENILAVDDNLVNLEAVKTRLEMNGWKVLLTSNGEEALKEYREKRPDVVLLDVMMPGMSGYEVCRQIREMEADMDQISSIIFLTAKNQREDKIYGINVGGDDYVSKPFDKEELVIRIASHIRSRQMMNKLKHKQFIDHDLELAGGIQKGLFPKTFPQDDHIECYGNSQSAIGVGGDYYDILKTGNGKYFCMIADVMGKGISAALVAVKMQTLLWTLVKEGADLLTIARNINQSVYKDFLGERYVTAILLCYDALNREAEYMNFGHMPVLVFRSKGKMVEEGNFGQMPFGMKESLEVDKFVLKLHPQDVLVLYTDGVVDAMNKTSNMFGVNRLKKILVENGDKNIKTLYKIVMDQIAEYAKDTEQSDDITMLLIKGK